MKGGQIYPPPHPPPPRPEKKSKEKNLPSKSPPLLELKLVSAIILFFAKWQVSQKLRKTLFISSKKLFSFPNIQTFVFPTFPFFLPVSHCLWRWSKINLNHQLIKQNFKKTNAIWYVEKSDIETGSIDRVLNKEHSYGKSIRKMCIKN